MCTYVHRCTHACMRTCTRACVRACVCTYMSACVGRSLYLNMCACTCICIHVCACICMHIYVFVCLCISMRMHAYICMHVCTYIYMSLPVNGAPHPEQQRAAIVSEHQGAARSQIRVLLSLCLSTAWIVLRTLPTMSPTLLARPLSMC